VLIYDLDIKFAFGRIGIETRKGSVAPKMDIHKGFNIDLEFPELAISNTFPTIEDIDVSHCRADMGNPEFFTAYSIWYNQAKEHALEQIGSIAAGGDALGAIEKGVSIGDIVEMEFFSESPDINVEAVPKTPPKITFKMGKVNADILQGRVIVDYSYNPITIDYERATVNIFLEQNPYITVKAVPAGKNLDMIV